jgi:hypothetical protein
MDRFSRREDQHLSDRVKSPLHYKGSESAEAGEFQIDYALHAVLRAAAVNRPNASYFYPETNTNKFVRACGLNLPEVEGFRIRIFLPPRRKGAKLEGER